MGDSTLNLMGAAPAREPSISTLIYLSAERFNVRASAILGPERHAGVVQARHTAMYLARRLTNRSLPEIGRRFGNRHHTTVMSAVDLIERQIAVNASLYEDVMAIRAAVQP